MDKVSITKAVLTQVVSLLENITDYKKLKGKDKAEADAVINGLIDTISTHIEDAEGSVINKVGGFFSGVVDKIKGLFKKK